MSRGGWGTPVSCPQWSSMAARDSTTAPRTSTLRTCANASLLARLMREGPRDWSFRIATRAGPSGRPPRISRANSGAFAHVRGVDARGAVVESRAAVDDHWGQLTGVPQLPLLTQHKILSPDLLGLLGCLDLPRRGSRLHNLIPCVASDDKRPAGRRSHTRHAHADVPVVLTSTGSSGSTK